EDGATSAPERERGKTSMQNMQTTLLVLLLIIDMHVFHCIGHAEEKPFVGFRGQSADGKEYTYEIRAFKFGIEQWDEGKINTSGYERWRLTCKYPDYSGVKKTECDLDRERVVLDKEYGAFVVTFGHHTRDGTLQIQRENWKNGNLDFD